MYEVKEVDVMGSPMDVFLFRPDGAGPHPGIVLAQHIPVGHAGLENDTFTLTTARRIADAGYCVAVPFIFHWWPREDPREKKQAESRDSWMVADMQAAFTLLRNDGTVDPERIGIVGHCWGGRVAWLSGCHIPEARALAVFYGGNIGKPMGDDSDGVSPLAQAGRIPCPVIGFFGNEDSNPAPADVADYSAALTAAGVPHQFHQYDGAGHAFQNFPAPERYSEAASEDAWEKLLAFLAEILQNS